MGFSIGEMGWLVEIVGLLWAGTIQLFHRFLPINQPNYIHDSTFCRFLHGLVKCFCWSSMFWLKWAKKSVLFFPKSHLFNRAMGLPKHERNGFTPKLPTAFFLRLLPGKEVWPHRITELTGRGEAKDGGNGWDRTTGRNLVDSDPLIEVSAPYQWSALQLGTWRLSRCLLGMNQKWLQSASLRPKNLEWSARSGELFFWGQLNEMQWLTVLPKKCVHFHVFISSVGTRNFCLVYFLRGHLNICRYILIHTDT